MGEKRRKSSDRLKIRGTLPPDERDTLRLCPACSGLGGFLIEYRDGTFKQKKCSWCTGTGYIDEVIAKMFQRWCRILKHNKHDDCKIRSTIATKIES